MDAEADVRYAISGDARLAFKVLPGGPHDIVRVPSWISNQDFADRDPLHAVVIERLTPFATVVSYDQRGTGLSDPVSLAELPTLEGWADDLHAVVTSATERVRDRSGVVLEAHSPRPALRGPEARVMCRVDRIVKTHVDTGAVEGFLPLRRVGQTRL